MGIPLDTPRGTSVWSHDWGKAWRDKVAIVTDANVAFVQEGGTKVVVVDQARCFLAERDVWLELAKQASAAAMKAMTAFHEHMKAADEAAAKPQELP
jgi:hypothetical protein